MVSRKDQYYFRAKKENYRSRAAYKLLDIQKRFGILAGHENVLEIGSSPGGWTQVLLENTDGVVLSIDKSQQEEIPRISFIRGDIFSQRIEDRIADFLKEKGLKCFDLILSDAMAKTSGISHRDHALSVELCERVMQLSGRFLCHKGTVLVKQFQGDMTSGFQGRHGSMFTDVKLTQSKASRAGSSEIYILFRGHQPVQ